MIASIPCESEKMSIFPSVLRLFYCGIIILNGFSKMKTKHRNIRSVTSKFFGDSSPLKFSRCKMITNVCTLFLTAMMSVEWYIKCFHESDYHSTQITDSLFSKVLPRMVRFGELGIHTECSAPVGPFVTDLCLIIVCF